MPRYSLFIESFLVTTALMSSAPLVSAGQATPSASTSSLIDAYTAALNAHEAASVERVVRGGTVVHGRQEIAGLVTNNLQGLPDLTLTTESVIVGDDRIAWAWVDHGTDTGHYPGLPAGQGQPIELRGVSLLPLRGGQIADESIYYDNYGFLVETGAQPSSATPASATPAS